MQNVTLWGSHQSNNFGDSLLAYLFGKLLASQGLGIIAPTLNKEARRSLSKFATISESKDSCATLMHGGGYFGESPSISPTRWAMRFMRNHFLPNIHALHKNKPLIITGVGVGPINSAFSKRQLKMLFDRADAISVRDLESKYWLEKIGIRRNIEIHPDYALGVLQVAPELFKEKKAGNKNLLTIHLGRDCRKSIDIDSLCDAAVYLSPKRGWKVAVIDDHEGDRERSEFCNELTSKIIKKGVEASYFTYSRMDLLLDILQDSAVTITDKLHVGICTTGLGGSVVSVPKHPKTNRFYEQLGVNSAIQKSPIKTISHMLKAIEISEEIFHNKEIYIRKKIQESTLHGNVVRRALRIGS